ncbi:hypothetical protein CRE_21511 [Caenorhabditis remanei]|uniref:Uncharacterized protein n=1 Tax=Caenorhabditis remanei TaxID=31234 RepID=E3N8Y7_CAERE|nr:hypothetical protein CRE_21511 [Caenorhabditis remanei]
MNEYLRPPKQAENSLLHISKSEKCAAPMSDMEDFNLDDSGLDETQHWTYLAPPSRDFGKNQIFGGPHCGGQPEHKKPSRGARSRPTEGGNPEVGCEFSRP